MRLYDFAAQPAGTWTAVAERGENFSGGQRQRLALARALLHDTPVYIFDEATSNIDMESEEMIMDVIHRLAKKKTVILNFSPSGQCGEIRPDLSAGTGQGYSVGKP